MWLMLQQDEPDDFVIATGESHSVREFSRKRSDCSAWIGANTYSSIRAIVARRK